MRIDPQNPSANGTTGAGNVDSTQSTAVRNAQRSATPEPTDTVQLSSGQATVRQLVSQLGQVPDVRTEQVSALRSAIANGQYNPTNGQLANALASQLFSISETA